MKMKHAPSLLAFAVLFASRTDAFSTSGLRRSLTNANRDFCRTSLLYSETVEEEEAADYEDDEEDDEGLTPKQIQILRKEILARRRKKTLPMVFLAEDETDGLEGKQATLSEIVSLLKQHELVEVRGISKHNDRLVMEVAEDIAIDVSASGAEGLFMVGRNAAKGHAVSYFLPRDDDSDGKSIKLWTSRKLKDGRVPWVQKKKPVRDSRGQIILGEYK